MLNAFLESERASVASIVLQAQKRGQEKSPNPLNLLAPQIGVSERAPMGWNEVENGASR